MPNYSKMSELEIVNAMLEQLTVDPEFLGSENWHKGASILASRIERNPHDRVFIESITSADPVMADVHLTALLNSIERRTTAPDGWPMRGR